MLHNTADKEKAYELYNKYSRLMLYIAKDILHDRLLAEDAVSQAFIKIIENLNKIDMNNCNKTKSYVVTIIRNISFNMLTQQKRMVMRDELIDISDVTETVLDRVTVNEAVAKIAEGIAGLNKNYADILYLKLYMEYTNEEIAESDRGSQYTSEAFREEMKKLGVIQSISGVTATIIPEWRVFFATLKKELLYRIPTYRKKMSEVKTIIFRYVFIYYNKQRVYTTNPRGWPPVVYRQMAGTEVAA